MDKIIKYEITISPSIRHVDSTSYEFYSHDKNNAQFQFALDKPLTDTDVKALFYFNTSKAKWETNGVVSENMITVDFDTSLITRDEKVTGYLYFHTEEKEADVYQFRFAVKLSEIDKNGIQYKTHRTVTPPIDLSEFVTKAYLDENLKFIKDFIANGGLKKYDDSQILKRLSELENRPSDSYDDTELQASIGELSSNLFAVMDRVITLDRLLDTKADKRDIPDNVGLKNRVSALETKEDKDTVYDDSSIKKRIEVLESKEVSYDDTELKNRVTALESRKSDVVEYDDRDLKQRVTNLENRPDKDTVYDDTDIKRRIETIENSKVPSVDEIKDAVMERLDSIESSFLSYSQVHASEEKDAPVRMQLRPVPDNVNNLHLLLRFKNKNGNYVMSILDKRPIIIMKYVATGKPFIYDNASLSGDRNINEPIAVMGAMETVFDYDLEYPYGPLKSIDAINLLRYGGELDVKIISAHGEDITDSELYDPVIQIVEYTTVEHRTSLEIKDLEGVIYGVSSSMNSMLEYYAASEERMQSFITHDEFKPEVIKQSLETLSKQVDKLDNIPKAKLGQNLLVNSGVKVTNKQYPTTRLKFATQPVKNATYTLTVKVDAPPTKTGVVVHVKGQGALNIGLLNKVSDGIYSKTFIWNAQSQSDPYELVIFQTPSNYVEASVVWVKFVEGVDTDYNWYPNYNEVSNIYTFAEEASTAIESSSNLLENTLAEKTSNSEFMNYADIAGIVDIYGTGKYTLSFDIKAKTAGTMGIYMSGVSKYTFLQEIVNVSTDYKRITMHLDISLDKENSKVAALSFFGGAYGNGVIPTVRKLRLSKGIYKELPWKPSDSELATLYEKMFGA